MHPMAGMRSSVLLTLAAAVSFLALTVFAQTGVPENPGVPRPEGPYDYPPPGAGGGDGAGGSGGGGGGSGGGFEYPFDPFDGGFGAR